MMSNISICPNCEEKTFVIETYHSKLSGYISRRRVCKNCDHRFSTVEIAQDEYNNLVQAVAAYTAAKQSLKDLYIILEDIVNQEKE